MVAGKTCLHTVILAKDDGHQLVSTVDGPRLPEEKWRLWRDFHKQLYSHHRKFFKQCKYDGKRVIIMPIKDGAYSEGAALGIVGELRGALATLAADNIELNIFAPESIQEIKSDVPSAVAADVLHAMMNEKVNVRNLQSVVQDKRKDLEKAQKQLDALLYQQRQRVEFLTKHRSDDDRNWHVEAGLE